MSSRKKILICPLDWGIGHASRCIPIIRHLIDLQHEVIIAADNAPLALLETTFPKLQFIRFPGHEVHYSKGDSQVVSMMLQAPKLLQQYRKDQLFIEQSVTKYGIDAVISDNRFGAYSKKVHSVFISHQINIKAPNLLFPFTWIVNRINHNIIRKYNACWIPDFDDDRKLSGELSEAALNLNTKFIGPLSRFPIIKSEATSSKETHDLLILLSGPEPQRTILEDKLIDQVIQNKLKVIILRGLPNTTKLPVWPKNISAYNHIDSELFQKLVGHSNIIIARAGYSTIMDLVALKRTALLIPTPGQTEQEYLSKYLEGKNLFQKMDQSKINLRKALEFIPYEVDFNRYKNSQLETHLTHWLATL